MTIIIVPGFTCYPEEITFQDLESDLISKGHNVVKIAWPHFPTELDQYNFTNTISFIRDTLEKIQDENIIILGFSMGGILATVLASEFSPKKLALIVSPYQAGTDDDLAGKYKEWKETGYREVTSSKYGPLKIPFLFIEDAQKYNALELIAKVTCPKLFIAGELDEKVPLSVTKKFFDAASQPKEWQQIPNMEHKYQYQSLSLEQVNKTIIQFVES